MIPAIARNAELEWSARERSPIIIIIINIIIIIIIILQMGIKMHVTG